MPNAHQLEFNQSNLAKVMKQLMKQGYKDPDLREKLLQPATAKAEVAKHFTNPPDDWDKYAVSFADSGSEKPFHFTGAFNPEEKEELLGGPWKTHPSMAGGPWKTH